MAEPVRGGAVLSLPFADEGGQSLVSQKSVERGALDSLAINPESIERQGLESVDYPSRFLPTGSPRIRANSNPCR